MKYKVGDNVRIKKDLTHVKNNLTDFYQRTLVDKYVGMVASIKRVSSNGYRINLDGGTFDWPEEMFEGVVL